MVSTFSRFSLSIIADLSSLQILSTPCRAATGTFHLQELCCKLLGCGLLNCSWLMAEHKVHLASISRPQLHRLDGVGKRSTAALKRKLSLLWSINHRSFKERLHCSTVSHLVQPAPWCDMLTAFVILFCSTFSLTCCISLRLSLHFASLHSP